MQILGIEYGWLLLLSLVLICAWDIIVIAKMKEDANPGCGLSLIFAAGGLFGFGLHFTQEKILSSSDYVFMRIFTGIYFLLAVIGTIHWKKIQKGKA